MASRQRVFLPQFDPVGKYVVLRPFKLNGVVHVPGRSGAPSVFDNAQVNERRLRQLFEARRIGLAGAPTKRPSALSQFNSSMAGAKATLAQIEHRRNVEDKEAAERDAVSQASFQAYRESLKSSPKPPEHVNGVEPVEVEEAEELPPLPPAPEQEAAPPQYRESDFLNFDAVEPKGEHPAKKGDLGNRRRRRSPKAGGRKK